MAHYSSSNNGALTDVQTTPNERSDISNKAQDHRIGQIERYDTNASVAIPIEVFEKIYLNPQMPFKRELHRTFGNPNPL